MAWIEHEQRKHWWLKYQKAVKEEGLLMPFDDWMIEQLDAALAFIHKLEEKLQKIQSMAEY